MAVPSKSEILAMFAELDGKPDKHGFGDPFQYPAYEWLCDRESECGDSLLEPLQDAITETKHRDAATSGIRFLGRMPGSVRFLADIAVNHCDHWYRGEAVEALETLGELDVLRRIFVDVPAKDREYVGKTIIFMDAESSGGYRPLVSKLLLGRHPDKCWDESKARLGVTKSIKTALMVRDHPQLHESVRPAVNQICSELLHGEMFNTSTNRDRSAGLLCG